MLALVALALSPCEWALSLGLWACNGGFSLAQTRCRVHAAVRAQNWTPRHRRHRHVAGSDPPRQTRIGHWVLANGVSAYVILTLSGQDKQMQCNAALTPSDTDFTDRRVLTVRRNINQSI